jgi:benzoyl-CoA 2,3-dioxygenase component B
MPEYRGALLAPRQEDHSHFGTHKGKGWQRCPANIAPCCRLIVVQGDTEPASVEQQRAISAPRPLYDMRNLFQVNVEEGHTSGRWSICCKVRARTAARSRGAAAARSGDADNLRILGAFNEATPDWLSFFMFTYFTDRDGKLRLESPRSRASIRFPGPAASC